MKAKLPNKHTTKGQTIVEFALVMPILLLLVMGVSWTSLKMGQSV